MGMIHLVHSFAVIGEQSCYCLKLLLQHCRHLNITALGELRHLCSKHLFLKLIERASLPRSGKAIFEKTTTKILVNEYMWLHRLGVSLM